MNGHEFIDEITALMRKMRQISHCMHSNFYKAMDLSPSQAYVIRCLSRHGPKRISELGSELNMPDSNISAICRRLENRDLIERERSVDDQRVVTVSVKPELKEAFMSAEKEIIGKFSILADTLSEQERESILGAMHKLIDAFSEDRGSKPGGKVSE